MYVCIERAAIFAAATDVHVAFYAPNAYFGRSTEGVICKPSWRRLVLGRKSLFFGVKSYISLLARLLGLGSFVEGRIYGSNS